MVSALEKYGFRNNFLRWIKLLLKNQELWIINRAQTTYYFKLGGGKRQGGDNLSAYCFILLLEKVFIKIKKEPNIKSLNVSNNAFLYTTYAEGTTFLQNEKSVTEILNIFTMISQFSGLKINKSK